MFIKEFLKKFNANYSKKTRAVIIIATFFFFYFSYHTLSGANGLFKYFQLSKQLNTDKLLLKEINEELSVKENNIKRIRPESLDLDLLDEQSRKLLGYSKEGEIVIYNEKKD